MSVNLHFQASPYKIKPFEDYHLSSTNVSIWYGMCQTISVDYTPETVRHEKASDWLLQPLQKGF